jgi:histidinol-phosphate/aromatic aminotransferase/cobyric acid decarboxylase-like protein
VPGEQPRIANLVKLNTNESRFGPSPLALEAMRAAAVDTLRLYPDPEAQELREALAVHHGIKPEQVIARRKNATLAQLSIAWPIAQGSHTGAFIIPIPGAKSRKHLEENVRAANIELTTDDLAEIDRIVPPGAASGTRYPIGQMHRVNI